jgi:hypothetical protein
MQGVDSSAYTNPSPAPDCSDEAKAFTPEALRFLLKLANDHSTKDGAQVEAASILFSRGWAEPKDNGRIELTEEGLRVYETYQIG